LIPHLLPHPGPVTALAIAPDGKLVLTVCKGPEPGKRQLRLFDTETGKDVCPLVLHPGSVTAVAFGPDERTVWVGGEEGSVWVWEPESGRTQLALAGQSGPVRSLVLSPANDMVAVGTENLQTGKGEIRLWDAFRRRPLRVTLAHQGPVTAAAFSPDG